MMRGLVPLAALLLCSVVVSTAGQPPQTPPGGEPGGGPQGGPPGGGPRFTPPKPKNLKVLPKDIEGERLMAVMRGFGQALGVRCVYCHVAGANERDLNTYDFASDEKDHKNDAREMLKFTDELNKKFPEGVGEEDHHEPGELRVTCWTCHRGDKQPQTKRPEGAGGPGPGGPGAPGQPPAGQQPPPPGQQPSPPAAQQPPQPQQAPRPPLG